MGRRYTTHFTGDDWGIIGSQDARAVFNKIVWGAWSNGEPGMIFLDQVNRDNPTPHLGKMIATNPCVTADTWIHTVEGPRQVKDLIGQQFVAFVDGTPYMSGEEGFFSSGVKPVVKLITKEGYSVRLTEDHKVWKVGVGMVPAKELVEGDEIRLHDHRNVEWLGEYTEEEGYLIGLLIGDGTLKKDRAIISVWGDDKGAISIRDRALKAAMTLPHRDDFKGWQKKVDGRDEYRMSLSAIKKLALELGMSPGDKSITPQIEMASSDFCKGFLRGFFDADGTVGGSLEKGCSVRLGQSDMARLEAVLRMLGRLGIVSRIYTDRRKAGETLLPDGKGGSKMYKTKAQHELAISQSNIGVFHNVIGFGDSNKYDKLHGMLSDYSRGPNAERFTATISVIEGDSTEEVYDTSIPGPNAFSGSVVYLANCSEQPLLSYESCTLGSINLSNFVKDNQVDYERLKEIICVSTRFLDSVIDKNVYAVDKIRDMTRATRKIGLGVMGWADMLIKLGIPYSSNVATQLANELMSYIRYWADVTSKVLAVDNGPYPEFEGSDIPIRNACRLTVAPTGTISMIAGCSSGIEPLFALSYRKQNILEGASLVYTYEPLEDIARARRFYSEDLMDFLADGGSLQERDDVPEDVRRLFLTAGDLTYEHHIGMQAAFQKSVDSGISKTINLPHDATVEDVEAAYMMAWRTGCKGITVYRMWSRENEVLTTK